MSTKVNILLLNYQRHTFTQRVKDKNLNNAGMPFELIEIDRKGISAAFNEGLRQCDGSHVVFMANDILMPDNWLSEMVRHIDGIPNSGIVGIHTVETLTPIETVNGFQIHPVHTPFGNTIIKYELVDKIGGYNEDYDPYGMQDSDYGERAKIAGYLNYYLPNMKAEHIGHDVGDNSDYRRMKDEGLALASEKWQRWTNYYHQTGNIYLPLIDQMYGE